MFLNYFLFNKKKETIVENKTICFIHSLNCKEYSDIKKTFLIDYYKNLKNINGIDKNVILVDDKEVYDKLSMNNYICELLQEDTDDIIYYITKLILNKYNTNNNYNNVILVEAKNTSLSNKLDSSFKINIKSLIKDYNIKSQIDKKIVATTFYETSQDKNLLKENNIKLVLDRYNNILYASHDLIPKDDSGKMLDKYDYKIHKNIFIFDYNYLKNYYYMYNVSLHKLQNINWLKILEQSFKICCLEYEKC